MVKGRMNGWLSLQYSDSRQETVFGTTHFKNNNVVDCRGYLLCTIY